MNNKPCFIVAEISANHGKSFKRAISLIKEAKKAGADAVKFQTYTADTLTIDCSKSWFMVKHPKWAGQSLYELYKKAYTPWHWFKKLKRIANDLDIAFFSTAYDKSSVDFLEELGVPFHKIASFELVDLPLIEYMAKTKKPIIISTGMGAPSEIREAVDTARKAGSNDITLLKCVSSYPARPEEMNLRSIPRMRRLYKCPIGLSDHTLGIAVPIAARVVGAVMIEKHFALSRRIKTADSFFSVEPHELKELVKNVREVEKALDSAKKEKGRQEIGNRRYRRSLFVVKDIKKGEIFTEDNIKSIRPSHGLHPKYLTSVLGRKARRDIKRGTPLKKGMYY